MGDMNMTLEIIGDYGDVLKTTTLKTGESLDITLEDGTALNIKDGTCMLEPK